MSAAAKLINLSWALTLGIDWFFSWMSCQIPIMPKYFNVNNIQLLKTVRIFRTLVVTYFGPDCFVKNVN